MKRCHRVVFLAGGVLACIMVCAGAADKVLASAAPSATAPQAPQAKVTVNPPAAQFLENYCHSCHDEGTTKGDVRLDHLDSLDAGAQLDLLNRMQEQVYLKQMPPRKKKQQPTDAEREQLVAWLGSELRTRNAALFEEKLRYPAYGNAVDHEQLFSGRITAAPYSPARRWLVSPQIFTERLRDVFGLEEKDRTVGMVGVTNPFLLPDAAGVRYYDNTALNGGHLLLMMNNADWVAGKQLRPALNKNQKAEQAQRDAEEAAAPGPKFKYDRLPVRKMSPAFETILKKPTPPTDDEVKAAVTAQFQNVLRRDPKPEEMAKLKDLTQSAITLSGNKEGLRQMLKTVLMDSEFLFRTEIGAGPPDSFGRKRLAPGEAACALSYAIGDRGPDPQLVKAAADGQLNTRDDYKREVLRLLAEKKYYAGAIDPGLSLDKGPKSLVVPHPRIVRFFREFFGYPNAIKMFKDPERSGFYFRNPERGSFGTAGTLVQEADLLVNHWVKKDQHVFENLLGGGEFYVAPMEDAANKMELLNQLYDRVKDTDWQKDPQKALADNLDLAHKAVHPAVGAKNFADAMIHVKKFRDKGLPPNPQWQYAFGSNLMLWINSYNLAPFDWNYAPEQPFRLEHRKGILTHPAWLIAFAQNTQTDPVIRGRWIREKLLAGQTPDIPITVEAVIPEDHHKTLRNRLELVTSREECWKCHQNMNPLGLPFEAFDDFGRFRTEESLEHPENIVGKLGSGKYTWDSFKTLPVNTSGVLEGTGDPALDGPVADTDELIGRLVKSARVRQSMIRYAFRFYMGRNEMLSDSKTLIEADHAYVKNGGSFNAVIVSLLTSDSFIYRK